ALRARQRAAGAPAGGSHGAGGVPPDVVRGGVEAREAWKDGARAPVRAPDVRGDGGPCARRVRPAPGGGRRGDERGHLPRLDVLPHELAEGGAAARDEARGGADREAGAPGSAGVERAGGGGERAAAAGRGRRGWVGERAALPRGVQAARVRVA